MTSTIQAVSVTRQPNKPTAQQVTARFQLEAMANLRPNKTGVEGAIVWVSSGEFSGADSQHGPRVKIVPGTKITREGLNEAASIRLTNPPQVIGSLPGKIKQQAVKFVQNNLKVLLLYWNLEIDTQELLDQLVH